MLEFLKKIIGFFNQTNIPYMLSGSVAMSVYTLPRSTRDFDFVVHLKTENIDQLLKQFGEGYYCDEEAVKEAVLKRGMFNIIDHVSGFKADFMVLKEEDFRQTEFSRRKVVNAFDISVYVVSPEDLIISKLIWIQEYQSAVQAEDLKLLKNVKDLDWPYINNWIEKLNLNTFGLLNV